MRIRKDKAGDEFRVEELRDRMQASRASRLNLILNEFRIDTNRRLPSAESVMEGIKGWYEVWTHFILVWAIYSSFFTPMEFGFFRGLPKKFFFLDIAAQIFFFVDIVLTFFVAYRDSQTYRMVYNRNLIALRYLKSWFILDLIGCFPWDALYKVFGEKEEVRYLLWIRLSRACRVTDFFHKMEKDIRINYLFTRIVKLIVVELYCTHTAACIFYYLATSLPASQEGYTWIGSLKMGDHSFTNFREIDLARRYFTSLYFAIVTMATVGYGDIHAVNTREMIFVMIYVSFDMILSAYLVGNMTALIVKGSNTERFRDKMTDLIKYMNRNKLEKDLRDQIKGHVRLQYESRYTDTAVLQDIPVSIRAKISQNLYKPYIENVTLFKECSQEFIDMMVIKLHEEFFLPGEVIMEQGTMADQLYFVCHGMLEEVTMGQDGSDETVLFLEPNSSFGEIGILCNIPQPYTVRVRELCRLLRIDKQSFSNILEICFSDGRKILNNLLQGKRSGIRVKQLESNISFHISKHEDELALRVNSAAHQGDLCHLKDLIRAGADPKKTDYDGRSPLHIAASRGYEDITAFLIEEEVEINLPDKFGNTPLLEAIKNGHDHVASVLVQGGALLGIDDAGCRLCSAVARRDFDFLKRVLSHGIDPNSKDYDHRTPLHIAAAEGVYLMAKMLLDAGSSVFLKDRWGNTPLDEARMSGSKPVIKLLEDAKSSQLSELCNSSQHIQDKMYRKKCTVFPFHPLNQERKDGVILWVPHNMEDLIKSAQEQLQCSGARILAEDAGKITDIDMIGDGQKLYLVSEGDSNNSLFISGYPPPPANASTEIS
ncbi:potassium channel SKOR-like isoform X3 [Magnolia sinica]|uniref:potassium channel SKOR-like isoform X3 n=1 Tax=Magnolia sinica TaxID=86752 RepID=UPI0026584498|nr:potassium channel SKOR-like isoform X3 [Magnolia sinica]